MISIYNKLQTYTSGQKTGSSKIKNKIVFSRKKSNNDDKKKKYYMKSNNKSNIKYHTKKEYVKSKRKYNSVNVPGINSPGRTVTKMSSKKRVETEGDSVMEKKLKVRLSLFKQF